MKSVVFRTAHFKLAQSPIHKVGLHAESARLQPILTVGLVVALYLVLCIKTLGQTNFAVLASDGAWTWYNDPRAVFHNGVLYFGYVRAADGKTVLSAFDLRTGQRTDLWTSTRTQCDDHNVPGLLIKRDGTMLATYARHGTDRFFTYRLSSSTNPCTPADWGPELESADTGAGVTYANPFQLAIEAGRIYNFARNLNYNPTVFVSTNGGLTWSAPQLVIRTGTGNTRPYVKYSSDYTGRIDFLYTDGHPRDVPNSLYHVYYQAGAFYKTDGTLLKYFTNLPIMHDLGERGSVIYQYSDAPQTDPDQWIPTGRAWCWEIATDSNGCPVCVFTVQRDNVTGPNWYDDRIYYYYARWTGTNWQKRFIAHAGRPLYSAEDDYAGGICIDPLDTRVVYISSNAQDPFNLSDTTNVPIRPSGRYELWRGITTNGGLSFTWQQITSNSPVDNLRPYVPRRVGGEPCVLWFRGTYTSYTAFNCAIVGLFTTKVPQTNTPMSGVWISDADGFWSHTTNWLDGVVADGAGQVADFGTLNITADRTVILDSPRTIGSLQFGDILGNQRWTLTGTNDSALTLSAPLPTIAVLSNTANVRTPLLGTNGFVKTGPGILVLAASNLLSGIAYFDSNSSSIDDGCVRIAHPLAVVLLAGIVLRNNNNGRSVLELDGSPGAVVIKCPITISCRNNDTPAIRNLAGSNILAGPLELQVGGNRVIFESGAGQLVFAGTNQYIGTLTNARSYVFSGPGDFFLCGPILNSTNGAPINVVKTGSGKLTVESACTYTGTTTVSNGVLRLNGSLASAHVTVAGGTLTGTGTIAGAVTVLPEGQLAPGTDSVIGTLHIGTALTNLGTVFFRVLKTSSGIIHDSISSVAALHCAGQLRLTNVGPEILTVGDEFRLFAATNCTGSFAGIIPGTPGPGLVWNTNRLYTDGILAVGLGSINPRIAQVKLDGTNFVAYGTGGPAGFKFTVVCSTNLALPMSSWSVSDTGTFGPGGEFSFTNPVAFTAQQKFFTIRIP